jgi:hypothetical protein
MTHRKWLCAVGATVVGPIIIVLFYGLLAGAIYLVMEVLPAWLMLLICIGAISAIMWYPLYEHCTLFWERRKK